jgi:hypothetical protein
MSAAEQSSDWQQQQANKAATFTPQKPEIPTDRLCAAEDYECKARTPPPPPGTEAFCSYHQDSNPMLQLVAAVALIGVVAILLAKAN